MIRRKRKKQGGEGLLHTRDNAALSAFEIDIKSLKGITQDSREVENGYLFAALKGVGSDGHDYIDAAIQSGATVILSEKPVGCNIPGGVTHIIREDARKLFSFIAAEYYGGQPEYITAVTGTNGKSSVVHFVDQFYAALGISSSYIGTLSGGMTTPDPVSLHRVLSQMHEDGVRSVALEASSHGLDQFRMDGVNISVAAFTSFSQDHLDYHADMDEYLAAKLRLFSEVLPLSGAAVLNADNEVYDHLLYVCKRRGIRTVSYGKNAQDIQIVSHEINANAQDLSLRVSGQEHNIRLPFIGEFQLMNILCALGCVLANFPEKADDLIAAIPTLDGVPGRLQKVEANGKTAYIDYAHTPDALENVLNAVRPYVQGRLICVFGCGGDRDREKRPLMGAAAERLADIAIVTDDNPRFEEPDAIRTEILAGMSDANAQVTEVAGRKEAIRKAVSMADEKDIVLVAGKGHEQGQVFKDVVEPFDDVLETRSAMLRG